MTIATLANETDLKRAADALVAREPRFAPLIARHGLPALRRSPCGLDQLLRIVVEQSISLAAARCIWDRIVGCGGTTADGVLALGEARLVALGLSGAKARCFIASAEACRSGVLDFARLEPLGDEEVRRSLIAVPGIGPWTADIFMLGALGRADLWPAGDVALQEAARHLLDLSSRPTALALTRIAEVWRPWRTTAALLLWSHYRHLRAMPQASGA